MAIAYDDHSLSQIEDANASTEWVTIDAEFRYIIRMTFACMASGGISTTEAGDTFISLLRVHLERFGILKQSKPRGGNSYGNKNKENGKKITEHLRQLKNSERKIEN